jgi:hypothetical protein
MSFAGDVNFQGMWSVGEIITLAERPIIFNVSKRQTRATGNTVHEAPPGRIGNASRVVNRDCPIYISLRALNCARVRSQMLLESTHH